MFLAALFMLAENLWYIHAVDYYSAMERSKLSIQATPRMNLRDATLDERDLTQECTLHGSTCVKF